ncbi:MAG TPA: hypothetical protein VFV66_20365 [Nonomuraea sp.]|nr:hypothetical protein [Nonomuraea sp.]
MADLSVHDPRLATVLGAEAAGALADLLGRSQPLIITDTLQTDGRGSGATVLSATIGNTVTGAATQHLIVKFEPDPTIRADRNRKEVDVWAGAGDFRPHLAERGVSFVLERLGRLSFHKIAQDSLRRWGPIPEDTPSERLSRLLEEITRSIVVPWNQSRPVDRHVSLSEAMDAHLGVRIRPGGTIYKWARPQGLLDPDCNWIAGSPDGRELPNPFRLATLTEERIHLRCGPAHGDLHPGNVLVEKDGESVDFVLIDADRYSEDGPLARDPVHLLLWLLAWDPPEGQAERYALIDLLIGRPAHGVAAARKRLVDAYEAGSTGHVEGAMGDLWDTQRLFSLAACALMFPVRPRILADSTWWWFVQLAAEATRVVLDRLGVRLTAGTPPVQVRAPLVSVGGELSTHTDSDDVLCVLRTTYFDPSSRRTFRASAKELATILRLDHLSFDGLPAEVGIYCRRLRALLTECDDPKVSNRRVAAIAREAEAYQTILVTLLERK